jgi:CRP-like cAMP-binding protein
MGLSTPQASRLVARALRRLRAALDGDPLVSAPREERYVRLADADPALFAGVREQERPAAVARRATIATGRWRGPADAVDGLGLLVLQGMLLRTVTLDGKPRVELIGPGDLIRSETHEGTSAARASWEAVQPVQLAVLDESLCRWPAVVDALLRRASDRSHPLAVQPAFTDLRRTEDRLLGLFGALADRWGRRVADGWSVAVPLTHDMIAMLVGVHRPSVTTALRRLEREGRVRRTARDRWLLLERPKASALPLAA